VLEVQCQCGKHVVKAISTSTAATCWGCTIQQQCTVVRSMVLTASDPELTGSSGTPSPTTSPTLCGHTSCMACMRHVSPLPHEADAFASMYTTGRPPLLLGLKVLCILHRALSSPLSHSTYQLYPPPSFPAPCPPPHTHSPCPPDTQVRCRSPWYGIASLMKTMEDAPEVETPTAAAGAGATHRSGPAGGGSGGRGQVGERGCVLWVAVCCEGGGGTQVKTSQ